MIGFNDDLGLDFLKGTTYIKRNDNQSPRINPLISGKPFGITESYIHNYSMMYINLSGLYAHFFMDGLAPILEIFEKDKDCLFVIDFNYHLTLNPEELSYWLWTKELFDKIGLKYRVNTNSKIKNIEVKNCHIKNNYQFKKISADLLYKYTVQNSLNYFVEPTKKVYLSRRFASQREVRFREKKDISKLLYTNDLRVGNEDLLENFLSSLGFETICPEQLSFDEQIKIMHETKILIGASQSGLFNALFMQSKQTLIELSTIMIVDNGQEYHDYWHSVAFAKMHNYISIPHNRKSEEIIENINKNKYLLEFLKS